MHVGANNGQTKAVAIIRDRDGYPKFDDFQNIPEQILRVLDANDLIYILMKRQELN